MSNWEIRYADEPDLNRWLNELSDEALEKITILLGLLKRCGNQLRLPHSKALGERLFELREKTHGLRIYYTYQGNKIIVLLVAGNKDSQVRDIKLARSRMSKLLENEK